MPLENPDVVNIEKGKEDEDEQISGINLQKVVHYLETGKGIVRMSKYDFALALLLAEKLPEATRRMEEEHQSKLQQITQEKEELIKTFLKIQSQLSLVQNDPTMIEKIAQIEKGNRTKAKKELNYINNSIANALDILHYLPEAYRENPPDTLVPEVNRHLSFDERSDEDKDAILTVGLNKIVIGKNTKRAIILRSVFNLPKGVSLGNHTIRFNTLKTLLNVSESKKINDNIYRLNDFITRSTGIKEDFLLTVKITADIDKRGSKRLVDKAIHINPYFLK